MFYSDYSDFIKNNPIYRKLEDDSTVGAVYEYLALPNSVYKMIEACKKGKSALSGVVVNLEKKFPKLLELQLKEKDFIKQAIGVMIKHILAPFGYVPEKPVRMPKNLSTFFSSAHTYEQRQAPSLKIVSTFVIKPVLQDDKSKS